MTAPALQVQNVAIAPNDLEAEQRVVGALFLGTPIGALGDLSGADFLQPVHSEILTSCRAVAERGDRIDVATVYDDLRARGQHGKLSGGLVYLSVTLADAGLIGSSNFAYHLGVVRDLAARRRLISDLAQIAARARDNEEIGQLADDARQAIRRIESPRSIEIPTAGEVVASETAPLPPAISTGIGELDELLGGGLFGESIYLVPGPTGRGKTAFGANLARTTSLEIPVVMLSTELRGRQIVARVAAQILGRPWLDIWRSMHLEQETITRALGDRRLLIADGTRNRDLSPRQIVDRVAQRYGRAPLLIVDYVQDLARRRGSPMDERRLAVAAVSDEIRQWALDEGGTAVLISSTARTWSDSSSGERQLRDYAHSGKESGDLDSDAAAIIALDIEPCPPGGTTTAILRVAKSRYLTSGEVRLEYLGATGLFRSPTTLALTPAERAIVEAVRRGVDSRTSIAQEVGGRRATVLATISALIERGVLTSDLQLAEGGL